MATRTIDIYLRADDMQVEEKLCESFQVERDEIPGEVRLMLYEVRARVRVDSETWTYDILSIDET